MRGLWERIIFWWLAKQVFSPRLRFNMASCEHAQTGLRKSDLGLHKRGHTGLRVWQADLIASLPALK